MSSIASIRIDTTDNDLQRRVHNYLYSKYLPSLRKLDVEASHGTVTLRGRVNSFYEKQVALHSCQRVAGVQKLVDLVEVA